jgi:hypothetical protein
MKNPIRILRSQQFNQFKKSFLQIRGFPFSDILSTDLLTRICAYNEGMRERIFTPLVTLKAFLFQALGEDGSCKQAVARILTERLQQGMEPNTVNTGPYCKARQRLPLAPLREAVSQTGEELHRDTPEKWNWKGHRVVLGDGTTALMPDTPDNQAHFPQQRNQKPGIGFPITRIVVLISLGAGTILDFALGPYQGKGSGETSLFSRMLDSLKPGDLLLADRYYCTYAIIALMIHKGVHVLFQNHAQRKPDFRRGKKLGPRDHIVEWNKPPRKPVWMSDEQYRELPEVLQIRELAVDGIVYVTTLMDAKKYRRHELAELYAQRWTVELDLRSIKTNMGMEMLRCKTPDMVEKEIAIHFLAYNLVRASMARAAKQFGKIPRLLSFKSAVQLLTQASTQLIYVCAKALKSFSQALLKAIASTPIAQQQRKNQPRAIKRRPKPFPLLTIPRHEACQLVNP